MVSTRPKDRLEGIPNFNMLKAKVLNILEENYLNGFVTNVVEYPSTSAGRNEFKKNQAKSKRIIFDSVKDHVVLIIILLKTKKELYDMLTNLDENKDPSKKGSLKNNICTLKMEKKDTIASYFTKYLK